VQSLGLSHADLAAYGRALAQTHTLSIELRVLNLSGQLVKTIAPMVNGGQVNIDADADVTRSATLTFLDETRALQFDSDSPADGAIYFDNMVRIWHQIRVPELDGRRVGCAVFTGPIVKFDRTGSEVSIEAQGKESLALFGVPSLTLRKGHNAIDAIRTILSERCGETSFAFPSTRRRLPRDVVTSWDDEVRPWLVCQRIAASLGLQLFYDGAGVCRLRDMPDDPVFRFHDGDGSNITSAVQVSHDSSDIRNRVTVVGAKPKFTWTANLPDTHPFSATRLARNGVRAAGFRIEQISDDRIASVSAARTRANTRIRVFERMVFGTTLNTVPVPHLDELDMIRVDTEAHVGNDRLRQWSFPLTGGDMSVGYNDLVTVPRRRVRRP
jgi:hypothetical protein